ncbi:MAG TPA: hemerythrin domain-containing protein [Micromonosporaceae bacterium]
MSQPDSAAQAADRRAAEAVVRHHAQLAQTLSTHTARLLEAADRADAQRVREVREDLVKWLHADLLPHAQAEESTLYREAAARPEGALLIDGMLNEHQAITALIRELENATAPVRVAAAARALDAMFASHLGKENDLVVPLLVRADDVSVAALLEGMHELIGGPGESPGGGHGR